MCAIQYVVSHFLEKLLAAAVISGSPAAEMAMVDELIRYMTTTSFAEAEVFTGIPEAPGGWIAGGHFRARTITAIAAARHSIVPGPLRIYQTCFFPRIYQTFFFWYLKQGDRALLAHE